MVEDTKKATVSVKAAPAPTLAPAGESGDPAVHKLLADLETARRNNDADGVKAAQAALLTLGFSS